jgi:hypothetical protein
VAYADAALDQLVPPFSVIAAVTAGLSLVACVRMVVLPGGRARRSAWLAAALIAAETGHVLSGLQMVDAPRPVYRSLARAPQMVAWKLRLWTRMIVKSEDVAWVRTVRNTEDEP